MTANEQLQNAALSHQLGLLRRGAGVEAEIRAILERADKALIHELKKRLAIEAKRVVGTGGWTTMRMQQMLGDLRGIMVQGTGKAAVSLQSSLDDLVDHEVNFQQRLLKGAAPVGLSLSRPSIEHLTAVAEMPYKGMPFRDWLNTNLARDKYRKLNKAMQTTLVAKGADLRAATKAARGALGAANVNAKHIARSAVNSTAHAARQALYSSNTDVIKSVRWLATLDGRTTMICATRDGKLYTPHDHKPINHGLLWKEGPGAIHWQCRSTSVPVLKSWKELGLKGNEVTPKVRASMNGEVPAALRFGPWLRDRAAVGDHKTVYRFLGKTKGQKFIDNPSLTIGHFADPQGNMLTLGQLQALDVALLADVAAATPPPTVVVPAPVKPAPPAPPTGMIDEAKGKEILASVIEKGELDEFTAAANATAAEQGHAGVFIKKALTNWATPDEQQWAVFSPKGKKALYTELAKPKWAKYLDDAPKAQPGVAPIAATTDDGIKTLKAIIAKGDVEDFAKSINAKMKAQGKPNTFKSPSLIKWADDPASVVWSGPGQQSLLDELADPKWAKYLDGPPKPKPVPAPPVKATPAAPAPGGIAATEQFAVLKAAVDEGKTLGALSKETGISKQVLSNWITGKSTKAQKKTLAKLEAWAAKQPKAPVTAAPKAAGLTVDDIIIATGGEQPVIGFGTVNPAAYSVVHKEGLEKVIKDLIKDAAGETVEKQALLLAKQVPDLFKAEATLLVTGNYTMVQPEVVRQVLKTWKLTYTANTGKAIKSLLADPSIWHADIKAVVKAWEDLQKQVAKYAGGPEKLFEAGKKLKDLVGASYVDNAFTHGIADSLWADLKIIDSLHGLRKELAALKAAAKATDGATPSALTLNPTLGAKAGPGFGVTTENTWFATKADIDNIIEDIIKSELTASATDEAKLLALKTIAKTDDAAIAKKLISGNWGAVADDVGPDQLAHVLGYWTKHVAPKTAPHLEGKFAFPSPTIWHDDLDDLVESVKHFKAMTEGLGDDALKAANDMLYELSASTSGFYSDQIFEYGISTSGIFDLQLVKMEKKLAAYMKAHLKNTMAPQAQAGGAIPAAAPKVPLPTTKAEFMAGGTAKSLPDSAVVVQMYSEGYSAEQVAKVLDQFPATVWKGKGYDAKLKWVQKKYDLFAEDGVVGDSQIAKFMADKFKLTTQQKNWIDEALEVQPAATPAPPPPKPKPVAKPKPAPAPKPKPSTMPAAADQIEVDGNWKSIGGQKGSNPGGIYEDADGVKWYVKQPASELHAQNELLANAFYRELGVDVPDMMAVQFKGNNAVASKIREPLKSFKPQKYVDDAIRLQAHEDMAIDAWLANWDVVGLEFDNMFAYQGKVFRIDQGGAMIFRATGPKKAHLFTDEVTEWLTLRDPSINAPAASVFKDASDTALLKGLDKLHDLSEDTITQLINGYITDPAESKALLSRMLKRRKDLMKRRDELLAKVKPAAPQSTPPAAPPPAPAPTVKNSGILKDGADLTHIGDKTIHAIASNIAQHNNLTIEQLLKQMGLDAPEALAFSNGHYSQKIVDKVKDGLHAISGFKPVAPAGTAAPTVVAQDVLGVPGKQASYIKSLTAAEIESTPSAMGLENILYDTLAVAEGAEGASLTNVLKLAQDLGLSEHHAQQWLSWGHDLSAANVKKLKDALLKVNKHGAAPAAAPAAVPAVGLTNKQLVYLSKLDFDNLGQVGTSNTIIDMIAMEGQAVHTNSMIAMAKKLGVAEDVAEQWIKYGHDLSDFDMKALHDTLKATASPSGVPAPVAEYLKKTSYQMIDQMDSKAMKSYLGQLAIQDGSTLSYDGIETILKAMGMESSQATMLAHKVGGSNKFTVFELDEIKKVMKAATPVSTPTVPGLPSAVTDFIKQSHIDTLTLMQGNEAKFYVKVLVDNVGDTATQGNIAKMLGKLGVQGADETAGAILSSNPLPPMHLKKVKDALVKTHGKIVNPIPEPLVGKTAVDIDSYPTLLVKKLFEDTVTYTGKVLDDVLHDLGMTPSKFHQNMFPPSDVGVMKGWLKQQAKLTKPPPTSFKPTSAVLGKHTKESIDALMDYEVLALLDDVAAEKGVMSSDLIHQAGLFDSTGTLKVDKAKHWLMSEAGLVQSIGVPVVPPPASKILGVIEKKLTMKGVTFKSLGKEIGVSPASLSNQIKKGAKPNKNTVAKFEDWWMKNHEELSPLLETGDEFGPFNPKGTVPLDPVFPNGTVMSHSERAANVQAITEWIHDRFSTFNRRMSSAPSDLRDLLRRYKASTGSSSKLSGHLRHGGAPKAQHRLMDTAFDIEGAEFTEDVMVYRGITNTAADKLKDQLNRGLLRVGDDITDPGYSSVAVSERFAKNWGHGVVYHLPMRKGMRAISLEGWLSVNQYETELVLMRGWRARIVKIEKKGSDWHLHLEFVQYDGRAVAAGLPDPKPQPPPPPPPPPRHAEIRAAMAKKVEGPYGDSNSAVFLETMAKQADKLQWDMKWWKNNPLAKIVLGEGKPGTFGHYNYPKSGALGQGKLHIVDPGGVGGNSTWWHEYGHHMWQVVSKGSDSALSAQGIDVVKLKTMVEAVKKDYRKAIKRLKEYGEKKGLPASTSNYDIAKSAGTDAHKTGDLVGMFPAPGAAQNVHEWFAETMQIYTKAKLNNFNTPKKMIAELADEYPDTFALLEAIIKGEIYK